MHTVVREKFEGKRLAGLLTKTGLEFAITEGLKVVFYCPFVSSYIKRHPEYEELVSTSGVKNE
ncbi:N-acetyltransferase [Lacibacter sediminis]|uniref:N-acetyltransferase n=2 Tax=Lacibacter sediminis TaxID=2760713 RepID=A0A7G5XKC3_9BACT|nr:N-acetyltransferase [Lacibacter sediminis]